MATPIAQWQTEDLPAAVPFLRYKKTGDTSWTNSGLTVTGTLGSSFAEIPNDPLTWYHNPTTPGFSAIELVHPPPPYCYLKIWLEEVVREIWHATFEGGSIDYEEVLTTGNQTYTYSPTTGLNLLDDSEPVDDALNLYTDATFATLKTYSSPETPPFSVAAPTDANRVTVGEDYVLKILKYSLVDGYEPDIDTDPANPEPNGYPDL